MIQPPRDPALPHLRLALDGPAMAVRLNASLPDCIDGRLTVCACDPCYVRYKPATSCLVQYRLELRDNRDAGSLETIAVARFYSDDHGVDRWAGTSLHSLVDRAARYHPSPLQRRAAYLPPMRALVQLFPVDIGLKALVYATSSEWLRRELPAALSSWAGRPADEPPELIRYKPARKALLRCRWDGGPTDTAYVKLFDDERGPLLVEVAEALTREGVATPRVLAYAPRRRLIVHEAALGTQLASLRGTSPFAACMSTVAETLARFQAAQLPHLPMYPLRKEAATVRQATAALRTLLPHLAPRLKKLADQVADALIHQREELATVHGDFYDDQAIVSADGVVLIDLDEIRLGHPLIDVGNLNAHLSVAEERGLFETTSARTAFAESYVRQRPGDERDIAVFETAALLKLAVGPFRRLETDWPTAIERTVALAECRFAESRRRNLVSGGGVLSEPVDSKLPQLAAVQDPARMSAELERCVYGTTAEIADIALVRHKVGRRALVRYDVRVGTNGEARRERLFGKTFASDRGARVHEISRVIAAAQACGPDVLFPEPVAYLPELKLHLQRAVPGSPVTPRLLAGDLRLAVRVAQALHRLHSSGLNLKRRHGLADELDPLTGRVDRLGTLFPGLLPHATACLKRIAAGQGHNWAWRWRSIHRDFYHEQILIDGETLALLDLDDASMSEPAVDVANFAAHLRLLGVQERADPAALESVIVAFRDHYRALDPEIDPPLLRFLEGATLLRLAEIHAPREHGERVARMLLDESACMLALSMANATES